MHEHEAASPAERPAPNLRPEGPARQAWLEQDLDPADWRAFRAAGHRMLDDMLDYLSTVRERPAWQPLPAAARAALQEPIPSRPESLEAVYAQFARDVLPYPTGNLHPRFWGWVMGNGTPVGLLAEMLAATMNAHVAGYDQAAAVVERQVLEWFRELMGFPAGASGLLVSGGTLANLIGLATARHARAGFDVRTHGLQGAERPRLLVYGSTETHSWAPRACELLGLGSEAFRRIPVDARYRIDLSALRAQLAADRAAGHRPICVVGNAGTVNTGAIDDLAALGDLCRSEGLWLHVDGAFGAMAALSPALRPQLAGLEAADSLAFDLHKWGWVQFGVGCVLVRDAAAHRAAFGMAGGGVAYLTSPGRGIQPAPLEFAELGVELSRPFRALKVWMSLKVQGVEAWGRIVEQNVRQARYLAERIEAEPRLELLAPVPLNVVCFRYTAPTLHGPAGDALNREVLLRVQESGVAVPSSTTLEGRFGLRVAITNHRSRREDFDMLVRAVLETGEKLLREGWSAAEEIA